MKNIAVLGAGSFGSAIVSLLTENGYAVKLWSFDPIQVETIKKTGHNFEYLSQFKLPKNLFVTTDENEAVENCDVVVFTVPSNAVRQVAKRFSKYLNKDQLIVNVAKGLEDNTLLRLSEIIKQEIPNNQVVVLSGPSHAEEIEKKLPTAVVVANHDLKVAETIQNIFMNSYLRVYTSTDVLGVELGGALKNVIALASGMSDGLKLGDNTKAAIITRGQVEIARLGQAMGADADTFNGLSGIGDLIVTCMSMHSRNRRAGILIGSGKTLEEALDEIKMVVEGVINAKAAYHLSQKYNVSVPIISEVYNVLFENKNPMDACMALMMRDKKPEVDN